MNIISFNNEFDPVSKYELIKIAFVNTILENGFVLDVMSGIDE